MIHIKPFNESIFNSHEDSDKLALKYLDSINDDAFFKPKVERVAVSNDNNITCTLVNREDRSPLKQITIWYNSLLGSSKMEYTNYETGNGSGIFNISRSVAKGIIKELKLIEVDSSYGLDQM